MVTRLPLSRLFAVVIAGFALTLVSNTLEPAVLGNKLLRLAPDNPNTALGFTTLAGLIVAMAVQPLVGVFSDRTRTRVGRRLPYMYGGAILVAFCLILIALAPALWVVVAGILLIQLGSNVVQGPWQALIPDQVPAAQRGQAAGVKGMLDILGFIVGRQVAGQLVSRYPQWGESAILAAVAVPIVVYALALLYTTWGAREEHATPPPPERSAGEALRAAFEVDLRAHPLFGWWFANRMLFWSAFIALNTFLLFFVIDVVGLPEAEAQRYVGTLSLILGGALLLVSIPSGWLADRIGRQPLVVLSGLVAAFGTGLLLFVRDLTLLTVAAAVIGLGIGTFISANWALITDIVPRGEAARYLGIANIAAAGGSALARFLGGALIDPVNRLAGTPAAGYLLLYGIAAGFFLLSALFALKLKPGGRAHMPVPG